jgi:hypothetical protein
MIFLYRSKYNKCQMCHILQFMSVKIILEQQSGKHCPIIKYQFYCFSMMQHFLVDMVPVVNM